MFPRIRDDKVTLYLNEEWWLTLTHREKLFVICHETLHVILDHGVRNGLSVKDATPTLVNIAQDITINEMIVDMFGFDRTDLRDWQKFCWIDTCFKDPLLITRNETFLYYLEKLIHEGPPPNVDGSGGPGLVDQHATESAENTLEQKKNKDEFAQTLAEELYAGELEEMLKVLSEASTDDSSFELLIAKKMKDVKFKFKAIIKKLKRTSIKIQEDEIESFIKDDRRFVDLIKNHDIALPGKHEVEMPKQAKLLTAVFMDVSGSCIEHFHIFQKVAIAFEREKELFDVRLFTFDTHATEINATRSARGAGGTRFDIIETKCKELEIEYARYPDCVIIISDGEGSQVTPQIPSRWIWLLTPFNSREYIHPKSRWWLIRDVLF
jgi:hypothetical protein